MSNVYLTHFRNCFLPRDREHAAKVLPALFVAVCECWPEGIVKLATIRPDLPAIVAAVRSVPGGCNVIPALNLTRSALFALGELAEQFEVKLPRAKVPSEFLVLGPGVYGRGITLKAARMSCKQVNGGRAPERMIAYRVPVDAWVDDMGGLRWPGDKSEGQCLGEV